MNSEERNRLSDLADLGIEKEKDEIDELRKEFDKDMDKKVKQKMDENQKAEDQGIQSLNAPKESHKKDH